MVRACNLFLYGHTAFKGHSSECGSQSVISNPLSSGIKRQVVSSEILANYLKVPLEQSTFELFYKTCESNESFVDFVEIC